MNTDHFCILGLASIYLYLRYVLLGESSRIINDDPERLPSFKMSVPARKQLSISSRGKVIISLLSSSMPISLHMLFRLTDDIYHLRLEFTRQIFEAIWVSPFPFSHALVWVEPKEKKALGVSFSLPCGSIVFCSLSLHSF